MKLEPTEEQLKVIHELCVYGHDLDEKEFALGAWDLIAPMVLEAAARLCDDTTSDEAWWFADRIRALKP